MNFNRVVLFGVLAMLLGRAEILSPHSAGKITYLSTNGTIRGRVTDINGIPATVSLYFVPVSSINSELSNARSIESFSNEEGEFNTDKLPSGNYYLYLKLMSKNYEKKPYFYPGVTEREQAAVIEIAPNKKVVLPDFKLPRQIQMQKIHVKVEWPDGSSAINANVEYSMENEPVYCRWPLVKKEGQGLFLIYGFKGTTYWVGATTTLGQRIILNNDPVEVRLVLQRK